MAKIYISDLANVLVEKHKVSKSMAQLFLTSIVSCIQDGITDDKSVKIKGLGTFKVVDVEARESVDVNTGERVVIESHQKLSFVPDTQLKNLVNKPFSQFETTVLNEGVTFDELDAAQETEAEEKPVVEPAEPVEEEPVEILAEEEPVIEIVEEEVAAIEEEPVVEEPAVEEPVVEEPVVEVPVVDVPVVEEPVVEEPVAEKDPEEAVAPVIAPLVELVEEPAAAEEPVEEEPAPAEEPVEEEPAVEEEPVDEEEPAADEPIDDEPAEDEDDDGKISPWLWLFLAVAACAASFVGGYYLGQQKAEKIMVAEEVVEETAAEAAPSDSIIALEAQEPANAQQPAKAEEPATAQETVKPAEPVKAQEETPDWKKYEDMDKRLFYGAYVIIGTDQVIQAREGETTARLASRTLGQGMECYIEVYNGMSSSTRLSAGQEVKIPKLKTKKALKKEMEQQQQSR